MAFQCLSAIDDQMPEVELEATRSTLFLTAKGLREQGLNYYLAEALFRIVRGWMRPEESRISQGIAEIADEEEDERKAQMKSVRSHWPVSVAGKSGDGGIQRLETLVEQYLHVHGRKSSVASK